MYAASSGQRSFILTRIVSEYGTSPSRWMITRWNLAILRAAFQKGNTSAGTVEIWDRGTYWAEQWTDDVIVVELDGQRVRGRYNLVRFPRGGHLPG